MTIKEVSEKYSVSQDTLRYYERVGMIPPVTRTSGGGQILICTAGEGWYQEFGKKPVSLSEGKVIVIPANVKHWHGAKADSWFSHIAFEAPSENTSNEWCEPVADEEYNALEER